MKIMFIPQPNPVPLSSRFHVRWPGRQLQQLRDRQPEQLLLQVPGRKRLMGIPGEKLLPFRENWNVGEKGAGVGFLIAKKSDAGCGP